jgi:hypothetical protein
MWARPRLTTLTDLVRHYFLRQRPHQADLAVNLSDKKIRNSEPRGGVCLATPRTGHRRSLQRPLQVAEIPPGPPVLSTLVFEVYGPDNAARDAFAGKLQNFLRGQEGIVDVDTYVPSTEPLDLLSVDREKPR